MADQAERDTTMETAASAPAVSRRTLVLAGLAVAGIALFFGSRSLHDELQAWAVAGVQRFGLPLLFALVAIADFLVQPVPPDLFVFAAAFGGVDVFTAAIVGGVASTAGGTLGYAAGRCLGPWRFCRLFGRRLLRAGRTIFRNYGGWAIFVAAVTPVPYSGACWVAGIYRLNPAVVVLTSLLSRTGRYLIMAELGHLA